VKTLPLTPEEQRNLKQFERDQEYLWSHRGNLRQQHPDKWIAIYHQQVVAVADTFDDLHRILKEKDLIGKDVVTDRLIPPAVLISSPSLLPSPISPTGLTCGGSF